MRPLQCSRFLFSCSCRATRFRFALAVLCQCDFRACWHPGLLSRGSILFVSPTTARSVGVEKSRGVGGWFRRELTQQYARRSERASVRTRRVRPPLLSLLPCFLGSLLCSALIVWLIGRHGFLFYFYRGTIPRLCLFAKGPRLSKAFPESTHFCFHSQIAPRIFVQQLVLFFERIRATSLSVFARSLNF